jgi:hypothetical protein
MVQHNVQNPTIALRYVIYNELSQTSRNPNNMALILMLFQTAPEVAPKVTTEPDGNKQFIYDWVDPLCLLLLAVSSRLWLECFRSFLLERRIFFELYVVCLERLFEC